MSTPFFFDSPIFSYYPNSWPGSPDRDALGVGRDAYKDNGMQLLLHSNPGKTINLSELKKEVLDFCKPFDFKGVELYEIDPVSKIMTAIADKDCYITDDYFPPSVWWNTEKGVNTYKRIKDKISTPVMFGKKGPTVVDVYQSGLGDCGFVSTIGALSLHPEGHNLLFSSIYPCTYNPLGVYSVRFIVESKIYYILIDDLLPDEGYSSMEGSEFWYFIIEKACAKLYKGYSHLGGGYEKFFGITGTSNRSINNENASSVWNDNFLPIFQQEKSVTYQGTGSKTKYLVAAHAYAIIDAAEWNGIRLVRLHNPWNVANYTGPYCPGSDDWNAIPNDVKSNVFQYNRFYDKTFWMPYDCYRNDIPKISNLYLSSNIPDIMRSICNVDPIQDEVIELKGVYSPEYDEYVSIGNEPLINKIKAPGSGQRLGYYFLDDNCLVSGGPKNTIWDQSMPSFEDSSSFTVEKKFDYDKIKFMAKNWDYYMNSLSHYYLTSDVLRLKVERDDYNKIPVCSNIDVNFPVVAYWWNNNKNYPLSVNLTVKKPLNMSVEFNNSNDTVSVDISALRKLINSEGSGQRLAYIINTEYPGMINDGPTATTTDQTKPDSILSSTSFNITSLEDDVGNTYKVKIMAMNGPYNMNARVNWYIANAILKLSIAPDDFEKLPANRFYQGSIPLKAYWWNNAKYYELNVKITIRK